MYWYEYCAICNVQTREDVGTMRNMIVMVNIERDGIRILLFLVNTSDKMNCKFQTRILNIQTLHTTLERVVVQ